MGKLIFTSRGLTSLEGPQIIGEELRKDGDLKEKRIFVFQEPYDDWSDIMVESCLKIGFLRENVILSGEQISDKDVDGADYIYVTEGNTFKVLACLKKRNLVSTIREAVRRGTTYIGSSAGAMIAGTDIKEAASFDEVPKGTQDFTGLQLFDGLIIPHYEPEHLEQYIQNSPGIKERYKNFYSVDNDGILVLNSFF